MLFLHLSQIFSNKAHKINKRVSRNVLKGGRIKDDVLLGLTDDLYQPGKQCKFLDKGGKDCDDCIKTLFSKEITDPQVFYNNLQCIGPLYRFNEFVSERLKNKNFVLYDAYDEVMLYNFADSGDSLECLIFQVDVKFTINYRKTTILHKIEMDTK
jgi:SET domain-containing protein